MEWKAIVINEFEKLREKYDTQAKEIWSDNLAFRSQEETTWPLCKWETSKSNSKTNTTVSEWHLKARVITQKVENEILPFVAPLPIMKTWVPIPKNFVVHDTTELVSMPVFEDVRNDDNFIDELIRVHEEYRGDKKQAETTMDDDMFIELVEALIPFQNSAETCMEVLSSNNDESKSTPLPKPIIFESLLTLFPSYFHPKTTEITLQEKYSSLTAKPSDCFTNVDGPINKVLTRDQCVDSYRKLFCRRCLIYDCTLHGIPDTNQNFLRPKYIKRVLPKIPCKNQCYLIRENRRQAKGQAPSNPTKQNDEWTASDHTMFLALIEVFPDNYCVIAEIMLSKSCQQVHKFAKSKKLAAEVPKRAIHDQPQQGQTVKRLSLNYEHLLKTYKPCHHEGQCNKQNCECINCEKFCSCGKSCAKRVPICACKKGDCRSIRCVCYKTDRECDPESCRCADCKNMAIQKGLHKKLYVAASSVHGYGCFIKEQCEKDELIAEYRGEVISQEEGNRRGLLYDKLNSVYLFQLNDDFLVDSIRFGTKVRFLNHSNDPNCYSKVMMVNGDHRAGVYAKRKIENGEELCFDYRTYDPTISHKL